MADDPSKPPRRVWQWRSTTKDERPFAEPKTIEIVVVDAPTATPDVQTGSGVGVRTKVRKPSIIPAWFPKPAKAPAGFWGLLVTAAVILIFMWHWVLSPLVVHAEHTIERKLYGERSYYAPTSVPHTRRDKQPPLGFRIW